MPNTSQKRLCKNFTHANIHAYRYVHNSISLIKHLLCPIHTHTHYYSRVGIYHHYATSSLHIDDADDDSSYTFLQEEAKAPPLKKLRLIHRHKVSEVELDLDVTTSTDVFQALLRFEESLPTTAGRVNEFIGKLLERFFKERGVVVRVKIVALIGDLARTPGFDPSEVVDDLTAMIKPKGTK